MKNFQALAQAIERLEEKEGFPRHYLYVFDEPRRGTDQMDKTAAYMAKAHEAGLKTIGYTSWHGKSEKWMAIFDKTFAPAYNGHSADNLKFTAERGKEPWVYNNGLDRIGLGMRLWQSIKLGAKGRMEWIGLFRQGFAFHNLDGREPSKSCFLMHKEHGALPTPRWLGVREGLLDARIRLTLEKHVPASDPVLKLWSIKDYRNFSVDQQWTDKKLDDVRQAMIERLLKVKH